MPITPSYLELCVKLYIGQENSIKRLPGKYVTAELRLNSVYIDCQCCYSVCKPDIDLVLDVHPVERPARAGGVSIRTSRSFYWMNTSHKVDILYINSHFIVQHDYILLHKKLYQKPLTAVH